MHLSQLNSVQISWQFISMRMLQLMTVCQQMHTIYELVEVTQMNFIAFSNFILWSCCVPRICRVYYTQILSLINDPDLCFELVAVGLPNAITKIVLFMTYFLPAASQVFNLRPCYGYIELFSLMQATSVTQHYSVFIVYRCILIFYCNFDDAVESNRCVQTRYHHDSP